MTPAQSQEDPRAAAAPIGYPRLARSVEPRIVKLGRVMGYGNSKTGELWIKPVSEVEEANLKSADPRVAAKQQAAMSAGLTPGFTSIDAEIMNDPVRNSNPDDTIEYYTETLSYSGKSYPSFVAADCLTRKTSGSASIGDFLGGVGCAEQHIGNFTTIDFAHVYLDPDDYVSGEPNHLPFGPGFTQGAISTPTGPGWRNVPNSQRGLWDFGPVGPRGSGTNLVSQWLFFKNLDALDFRWFGTLIGEVYEVCGNGMDEDLDGENDNGCMSSAIAATCYSDNDCITGKCSGASISSQFGMAGMDLGDDTYGTCVANCGNSVLEGQEECDDGGTNAGDGCSATCSIEATLDWATTGGDTNDDSAPLGDGEVATGDDGSTYIMNTWQNDYRVGGFSYYTPTGGKYGGTLAGYSPWGGYMWSVGFWTVNGHMFPVRVIVDRVSGDLIVIGYGDSFTSNQYFVGGTNLGTYNGRFGWMVRLSKSNGGVVWSRVFNVGIETRLFALYQDRLTDDFIIGGDYQEAGGSNWVLDGYTYPGHDNHDAFIARIGRSTGSTLDVFGFGGSTGDESVQGISMLSTGELVMVGDYNNGAADLNGASHAFGGGGGDAWYGLFDWNTDAFLWTQALSGSGLEQLRDVHVGPQTDDIYFVGNRMGNLTVTTDAGSMAYSGSGLGTLIMRAHKSTGLLRWATGHWGAGFSYWGLRRFYMDPWERLRFGFSYSWATGGYFGPIALSSSGPIHVISLDGLLGVPWRYDTYGTFGSGLRLYGYGFSDWGRSILIGGFNANTSIGGAPFVTAGSYDQFTLQLNAEPSLDSGCGDGIREGFVDTNVHRNIAGCSGGWSVAGMTSADACGKIMGDDSSDATGAGCAAEDLCQKGWHVCTSAADVAIHNSGDCSGVTQAGDPGLFFATHASGNGSYACGTTGSNDIFGCGNITTAVPQGSCSPLNAVLGDTGSSCGPTSSWSCTGNTIESSVATHANGSEGGVICCRDSEDIASPPVTSGLVARFNAHDASSLTITGAGAVTGWNDISGGGHHLGSVQGTPQYNAAYLGGRGGVQFLSDSRLNTAGFTLTSSVTVFAAVQNSVNGAEGWGAIAHHGSRDGDWSLEQNQMGASIDSYHFQSSNDNAQAHDVSMARSGRYVLTGRLNATGPVRELYITSNSGTTSNTSNTSSLTTGTKQMYVGTSDNNECSNMIIGEILYYDRALSDAERDQVIQYLVSTWGI